MGMVYMIILCSTDEADLCYQLAVNEGDELDHEDVRDLEIQLRKLSKYPPHER